MAGIDAAARREQGWAVEPVHGLWRLLTSVRLAVFLIAFLALASLAGVLIPQLPAAMRGNEAAEQAWLEFQRGRFGFPTTAMWRLGLFDVFRSLWFASGLTVLVVSVCACTINRIGPSWRNVTRPPVRVPDDYFDRGQPVIEVPAADVDGLVAELRRRRFRVETRLEADGAYIFADRFPWAQLATFISHLALVLFIGGGLITVLKAKETQVFVGEGETFPVFSAADSDHMQVYVEDAVGRFDGSGFPLEFRTLLTVHRAGREIGRGVTTVNSPLKVGGFSFHQSAYFPDGAELRVRDVVTGRLVYAEVLPLDGRAPAPLVRVADGAGRVLLQDLIVATDFLAEATGATVAIPGSGRQFWIGLRGPDAGRWQLVVFEVGAGGGARALVSEGEQADMGGLVVAFQGMSAVPSSIVRGLPGAPGQGVVAGVSSGPAGKILSLSPVGGRALVLTEGESATAGGYEYTFAGAREFAGITVRRDPGSAFIWVATGLLLTGLVLTFYTPRRRLWGRVRRGVALFRGVGGRESAIEREVRQAALKAAAPAKLHAEERSRHVSSGGAGVR